MEVSSKARDLPSLGESRAGFFGEPLNGPRAGMDVKTLKRSLRRETVARILALEAAERQRQERALLERFPALPGFDRAETVLLYVSAFPEEVSTRAMLRFALERKKRLVLPCVDRPARRLRLLEVRDLSADLAPGSLGIPEPGPACLPVEPEQVDWVLVPGLAFDARAYRLGRGAGHYDRLLPMLRPGVPRWSIGLDCQAVERLPLEPHDQPLDGVAYPDRTVLGGSLTHGA